MSHSNIVLSDVLKRAEAKFVAIPVMRHIGSIEYAIASIADKAISGDIEPTGIFGTMRAGKTTTAVQSANKIAESGRKTYFYSLVDNRGVHFNRNGLGLDDNVINGQVEKDSNAIEEMIKMIISGQTEEGSVLFLSEIQFANDFSDKVDELIRIAKEHNIKIVFDCLYRFFKGDLVPATKKLETTLRSSGSSIHNLVTIDCFDERKEAEVPARFLRFYEEGESVVDDKTKVQDISYSDFYSNLSRDDIGRIIQLIKDHPYYSQKLIKTDAKGNTYYLLPAHFTDNPVVLGGDNIYLPTSLDTLAEIFTVTSEGITDSATRELYLKSPKVVRDNYNVVES